MEKKNYIIAIDLGSTNVTLGVAEKVGDDALRMVYVVQRKTDGVKAGLIENIEQVGKGINSVVAAVEKKLGFRVTEAYAGISGQFVRCARHTDHVFVYDPQNGVSSKDLEALFDRMRNIQAPDDELIMERVPQSYKVDDNQEVDNPQGSFCRKLSSTFNFVLCQKVPIQRLEMALKRAGIKALKVLPNSMVNPEPVLEDYEKEEGVAVVNIGGGLTDVTVYHHNCVRYVATIPMGASAINHDIATMGIPEKYVENLKRKFGCAVADLTPDDVMIRFSGRTARESREILMRNLATVIEARSTDIAEFVKEELQDSGYLNRLMHGIILTGGSAKVKNMDELFHRVTGLDVRIGLSDEDAEAMVSDPSYATIAGLLMKGAEIGTISVMVDLPEPEPKEEKVVEPTEVAKPTSRTEDTQERVPVQPTPKPTPQPTPKEMPVEEPQIKFDEPQEPVDEQTEEPNPQEEEVQPQSHEEDVPKTDGEEGKKPSRFSKRIKGVFSSLKERLNNSFSAEDEEI